MKRSFWSLIFILITATSVPLHAMLVTTARRGIRTTPRQLTSAQRAALKRTYSSGASESEDIGKTTKEIPRQSWLNTGLRQNGGE